MVGGVAEQRMQKSQRAGALAVVLALAVLLHLSLATAMVPLAGYLLRHRRERSSVMTSVVEFETPPPPPPPSVPPTLPTPIMDAPPTPPEPVRGVHRVVRNERVRESPSPPPPPPPAPTEAAPVMVVDEEFSNESQDTMPVGNNPNATGDVASNGVVRAPGQGVTGAAIGGTADGTGRSAVTPPPAAPPVIDYSSRATVECDEDAMRDLFPEPAREAGISEMLVRVRIAVDANGRITRVLPLNDPGYGFVNAAERGLRMYCRAIPARDRDGRNVPDTIPSFRFRFVQE